MSQIFIARLQEIQRVHIPHSRCSHSIQKKLRTVELASAFLGENEHGLVSVKT